MLICFSLCKKRSVYLIESEILGEFSGENLNCNDCLGVFLQNLQDLIYRPA